jgi:2-polyprenyl-3-methyl-5-hydroxy-6-metoxy-1,4-benzoquinol methylase
LVARCVVDFQDTRAHDDASDFYGRQYWFDYQVKRQGFPNVIERSRLDLPERCLFWLRTVLQYQLPPGQTLDIGCSHGGFVALLQLAGFQAAGLEMSEWVVEFARRTFEIPVFHGPLEDQNFALQSLDIVTMNDVLEHMSRPLDSVTAVRDLLKNTGILVIQMPCYPEGKSYADLEASADPFIKQLKVPAHLFLFSKSSIKRFLNQAGFPQVAFEPAIFSHYDMYLVAGKAPFSRHTLQEIEETLLETPGGRMALALLDLDRQAKQR